MIEALVFVSRSSMLGMGMLHTPGMGASNIENSTHAGDMTDTYSEVEEDMDTGTALPDHKPTPIMAMEKGNKGEN